MLPAPDALGSSRPQFRPDIDGLRAIAILMVVLYHTDLAIVPGGFAGVDVFFVISGFLITRNLLAPVLAGSSPGLATFWARRIRRLVPALSAMILATLVLSGVVLAAAELPEVAKQGGSSALYISNILFAAERGDYFGFDLAESPFLHTWSLSVEEQFYVIWPVFILILAWLIQRRPAKARPVLIAGLAAATALSFAASVLLTYQSPVWAFFSSPTRAWEFGAGALLAVMSWRPSARAGSWMAGLGVAVLALTTVLLNAATPYPGLAAVAPVLATSLVIVGGSTSSTGFVSGCLRHPASQWLGRVSYSWYLWHWPVIVLGSVALRSGGVPSKMLLAAVSLPLAVASFRFVERPLRHAPRLVKSNRLTYVFALLVTGAVLVGAAGLAQVGEWKRSRPFDAELVAASEDTPAIGGPACVSGAGELQGACVYGDPTSGVSILLIGDSQAEQWIPVMAELAEEKKFRLVVSFLGGCPAHPVRVSWSATSTQESRQCAEQRNVTDRILSTEAFDVVIVADAAYKGRVLDESGDWANESESLSLWESSLRELIGRAQANGSNVGIILDSPQFESDPLLCAGRYGSFETCTLSTEESLAFSRAFRQVERAVGDDLGIPVFDPVEGLCGDDCPLRSDEMVHYSDESHLTRSYVLSIAPAVAEFVETVRRTNSPTG